MHMAEYLTVTTNQILTMPLDLDQELNTTSKIASLPLTFPLNFITIQRMDLLENGLIK